ncbi:MAG: PIN domain-containing protein [Chloroflexi bacterium]|nr:PIN domain-containing protein [Chloroflexota bacterium]
MVRVFLDSGVLVQGIILDWCPARAILILGSHGVVGIETTQVVVDEVRAALHRKGVEAGSGSQFDRLLKAFGMKVHARPPAPAVEAGIGRFLPLMRHRADIAILVAAISVEPDWLVTGNLEHFNPAVARASGLRIVSPVQLMGYLGVRQPNASE